MILYFNRPQPLVVRSIEAGVEQRRNLGQRETGAIEEGRGRDHGRFVFESVFGLGAMYHGTLGVIGDFSVGRILGESE